MQGTRLQTGVVLRGVRGEEETWEAELKNYVDLGGDITFLLPPHLRD